MGERPIQIPAKNMRSRVLASLGILAIVLLLLVWGLWGMQWTIPSTNNDLRGAVMTSAVTRLADTFSLPRGVQQSYPIWVTFTGCSSSHQYIPSCAILSAPVSNSSTTIDQYVVFSMTNPNGSAVTVWYSGPQGNLTQDCSGAYPQGEITCTYEPTSGAILGPAYAFFKISTPGNYSIHLLSTQCTYSTGCSSTTATGVVSRGISTLIYNRPYWTAGLATVIVAVVSIVATVGYLTVTSYQRNKQKPATKPPTRGIPTTQGID